MELSTEKARYGVIFTKAQRAAIQETVNWVRNPSLPLTRTIQGAAGTGKSTVVGAILDQSGIGNAVAVTAPTHKAVGVISTMTSKRGMTIQKLLGLRPNINIEDFDPNNMKFDRLGQQHIENYSMVVIDECSMIGVKAKRLIEDTARKFGTKILYIGDHLQLPPVKENISPTFNGDKSILYEIVRQEKDNPLNILLSILRYSLEPTNYNKDLMVDIMKHFNIPSSSINAILGSGRNYMIDSFLRSTNGMCVDNKGFILHRSSVASEKNDYGIKLINKFKEILETKQVDDVRFLAYKRNTVEAWNTAIRNKIFPNAKDVIVKGDLLVGEETVVDEYNNPIIYNSDDYVVSKVEPYTNSLDIKGYVTTLTSMAGIDTILPIFLVDLNDKEAVAGYRGIFENLLDNAINANPSLRSSEFSKFFEFKRHNILLNTLMKDDGISVFSKKSLDYAYCMTIHKSQGSTYKEVFVNVNDIFLTSYGTKIKDVTFRNKLLYVALSRARNKATLYL